MSNIEFGENKNLKVRENAINSIQEAISILDKNINTEKDAYKRRIYENQKLRLIDLKSKYEKLAVVGITKETQTQLDILSNELQIKAKKGEILGKDINEAFSYLTSEKKERMDNLIDRSTRDLVEKNIKFSNNNILKVRESEFETIFYEKFTIFFLDYLYENGLSENKKYILNTQGFNLSPDILEKLIVKTIKEVLDSSGEIEKDKKITVKLGKEKYEKTIGSIIIGQISDFDTKYLNEINSYIGKIGENLNFEQIQEIEEKIINYENFRKNIKQKFGKSLETSEKNDPLIKLKQKLKIKLNYIIEDKLQKIKDSLENINDPKTEKTKIDSIKKDFEYLKEFLSKVIEKRIFEILGDDNSRFYEKDLEEIEKSFNTLYFAGELDEINKLMEKLFKGDLKKSKENILNKINFLETKIQILISSNIIDKEYGENIVIDLRNNLYTKILYHYLEKSKISEITGRQDIGSLELFKVLTKAKKAGEITIEEIDIIIKLGSEQAFLKEFELPYIKARVENLKNDVDGKNIIDSWKDIFLGELGDIIGNEKSKELFLLSYLESIFDPESVSPYGAVGYFQLLPGVAKDFGMEKTDDLKDPIKSAKIAAKYLKYLLQESNGDLREALLKYNGWFTNRLIDKNTQNTKNNIIEISSKLLYCKSIIKNKKVSAEELITRITNIHTKYFDPKTIRDGKYHFRILDDNDKEKVSKDDIENWIDKYIVDILKQQYFYPEQFEAVKNAYEKSTN